MIRKIVLSPHPALQNPAKPVEHIDTKIQTLVNDMIETLIVQKDPEGVGLAAPQIGVGLRLFIIRPSALKKPSVFINPVIKDKKGDTMSHEMKKQKKGKGLQLEGCLSVPKIWASIGRFTKVLVEYQDILGKTHERWFGGFPATVIQHEMDHIEGILFTQRAVEQNQTLYQEKDDELEVIKLP